MTEQGRIGPVTAKDVASLAGVSRSAVSRTFTPGASVSHNTRAKVEAAASQLGYSPNLIARSLITRRSGIVGLILGQMDNPFYAALLSALSERLALSGKRLMLLGGTEGSSTEAQMEALLHYRVEALMIASVVPSSALVRRCRENGVPVIMINRVTNDAQNSSIVCDNEAGGYAIGRHMAELGCSRLGFMAGLEDSSTNRDRERGFRRALEEYGGTLIRRTQGNYDFALAAAAAKSMLRPGRRAEGIFCANDLMALALHQIAIEDFGLVPGRDFLLFGFDDIAMASWPAFQLATYSQPIGDMADAAVEMLDASDSLLLRKFVLPGKLVVRRSGTWSGANMD